jgi:hypothetical protein
MDSRAHELRIQFSPEVTNPSTLTNLFHLNRMKLFSYFPTKIMPKKLSKVSTCPNCKRSFWSLPQHFRQSKWCNKLQMYSEKRSKKTNVDDPPPHPGIKFHQDVTMDKTDISSLSGQCQIPTFSLTSSNLYGRTHFTSWWSRIIHLFGKMSGSLGRIECNYISHSIVCIKLWNH